MLLPCVPHHHRSRKTEASLLLITQVWRGERLGLACEAAQKLFLIATSYSITELKSSVRRMQNLEQYDKPTGCPQILSPIDSRGTDGVQRGEKEIINCALVGDSYGKTALVLTFINGKPYHFEPGPTIEDEYRVLYKTDDKQHFLSILDLTGLEEYSPCRVAVYRDIDVFLLCFSVMRSSSLEHIRDVWLPEIRELCPKAQFLLIGLQADLRGQIQWHGESPVAREKAISTAVELGAIKYIECSSKLNHGIQEVFTEALLAGIEVVAAKSNQPSAALAPSFQTPSTASAPVLRASTLSGSILGLPRKMFDFRGKFQGRREPGRLESVQEEFTQGTLPDDIKANMKSSLPMITQEEIYLEGDAELQSMMMTPEDQARTWSNFEETLSRTWVYTHLDRRGMLRDSSIVENATISSRVRQTAITSSRRSVLSVPISWAAEARHPIVSWENAERNATATLERYAATLESLQTEVLETSLPPPVTSQSYNNVSLADNARAVLGNTTHHNVTNHYVINYSKPQREKSKVPS
ncbi:cell division cycle 42 [Venturia nashicola]|nr:cell division cycle 42 [Venturia nashicola]